MGLLTYLEPVQLLALEAVLAQFLVLEAVLALLEVLRLHLNLRNQENTQAVQVRMRVVKLAVELEVGLPTPPAVELGLPASGFHKSLHQQLT